ncbi:hypothetical protein [Methanolapillus millepedarum]|uniref:Uncharacterized protein n=1 Tax=Methanolapillus millepedarum TaxID=3028296 RepID=A0AA96ZUF9_9EURY|nr:hypothetical protein MsAc7_11160 [Methanosarcinaceae archaeon Ac7]
MVYETNKWYSINSKEEWIGFIRYFDKLDTDGEFQYKYRDPTPKEKYFRSKKEMIKYLNKDWRNVNPVSEIRFIPD